MWASFSFYGTAHPPYFLFHERLFSVFVEMSTAPDFDLICLYESQTEVTVKKDKKETGTQKGKGH